MSNLNCKKPQPCPQPEQPDTTPKTTPAFSVCIMDYTLHWDGTHATLERSRLTTDGTYGSITVHDGCVVGFGECEVPIYTPPYCNPNPAPCNDGSGAGNGTTATVSPRAENQLAMDQYGLFSKAYVKGDTGITVTGSGTQSSPYLISVAKNTGGAKDGKIVGQGGISVEERSGVYFISLPRTTITAGKYGPFSINDYGQITAIDDNLDLLTADNVTGSNDVQITKVADGVTIDLQPTQLTNSKYRFGGYDVSISDGGRVINAEQVSRTESGVYKLGAYNITLDEYGGITDIQQSTEVPQSAGSFTSSDGSKVSYDDTGRITSVVTGANTGKGPIMDMYLITRGGGHDHEVPFMNIQAFGTPLQSAGGNAFANRYVYTLPSYITSPAQVEVTKDNTLLEHGNGYTVDMQTRTLHLSLGTNGQGVAATYGLVMRG